MYIDKATYVPLWEDLFDKQMQPNRSIAFFLHTFDIPGIGPQDSSNSMIYAFWDIRPTTPRFSLSPETTPPFTSISRLQRITRISTVSPRPTV
jgi:hypothetical protein